MFCMATVCVMMCVVMKEESKVGRRKIGIKRDVGGSSDDGEKNQTHQQPTTTAHQAPSCNCLAAY